MPASQVVQAAMWLQTADFSSAENTHLLMIFIGILAVSVAVIALAVLVVAIVTMRTVKKVTGILDDVKAKSMPIIGSTQGIMASVQGVVHDLSPKIKTISEDLQPKIRAISTSITEMTTTAQRNVAKFDKTLASANDTAQDVNAKARAQVDKLDDMVSQALMSTSKVAQTIHHSVKIPVNQVAGVVSGFKAGLDSLLSGVKGPSGKGGVSSAMYGGSAPGKGAGRGISLEARREEEMERITEQVSGLHGRPMAVPVASLGADIMPDPTDRNVEATPGRADAPTGNAAPPTREGLARDGREMAADVVAGQRRAAESRTPAADASDLIDPTRKLPPLPKRFQ